MIIGVLCILCVLLAVTTGTLIAVRRLLTKILTELIIARTGAVSFDPPKRGR